MADALHTPGVTSAAEARLDDAGLIAVQGPTALDARTGVLHGPGTTALVAGTADTAPMAYLVAPHHWVTSRGVNTDGVYRGALETATRVPTGAAPGSGSRIDVLYEKQGDANSTISPDGSTAPVYGVVQGDATTGTPVAKPIPVGAIELARATVSAGATATNGAGVVISNTARQTVARGVPIPVRNQAERDTLTQFAGLTVDRLDLGVHERSDGTNWHRLGGDRTIGDATLAAQIAVNTTSTWTDLAVVTGTSLGGECVARFTESAWNGNSGADRTMDLQVVCDGAVVGPGFGGILVPIAGTRTVVRAAAWSSTPAAGSHTWRLQTRASTASAVLVEAALLTVVEKAY